MGAGVAAATMLVAGGGGETTTVYVNDVNPPDAPTITAAAEDTPPAPTRGEAMTAGEIYRATGPGIMRVVSGDAAAADLNPRGSGRIGTGFVADAKGHVLTNAHVIVPGTDTAKLVFVDGEEYPARVVGRDEDIDVAVLKADRLPATARPLTLGSVRALTVGDPLVAIGNPYGLDHSVTTGIVSALKRPLVSPNMCHVQNVVQTDAAINQGNSGGPLLDARGQVVGINSQIASDSGANAGIALAVPIDIVRPVMASLIEDGSAEHAWLGVKGVQLNEAIRTANKLPETRGVMVVETPDGGPAKKAGLRGATAPTSDTPKGGDIITAVDGRPTQDMADVSLAVARHRVGQTIRVEVLRDGTRLTVPVTLVDRGACPR